ncbi:metal ABC transporter ATP-binding protein [Shimazuella kribbensis]|uniref:metal ABC transporter ATP-binding protein n=1 Tax=Shimazuella kribbensis TaxID=139808 RepID=UPI000403DF3D|nr:metal ABC transporter ATP-binding protein [Shimazuella kribbensis]
MANAVDVSNLYVSFQGKQVVQDVSFDLQKGRMLGIIGPNGAGKSTLLKAILGLIPNDSGKIRILDSSIQSTRKFIAYVPQRNDIDWDFPITVLDVVLIGTYPSLGLIKKPNKKHRDWALTCLTKVGMEEYKNRQIGELSGGQQQRVFLARALAQRADIFFLDEPFVGIDVTSEGMIIQILKELCYEGKTIAVVHHDLGKAESYFDDLLLLNKNVIHYGHAAEVLDPSILSKAYVHHRVFLNRPKEVPVS